MSFVRPEVTALLGRWAEVLGAGGAGLLGIWIITWGGYFFGGLGTALVVAASAFGVVALRRMRFRMGVDAPGVVEIDEGKIGYLGPVFGGYMGLSDLAELQVLDVAGRRRCWRLKAADGQALLIPFAAEGAAALFDAFAALPGAEPRRLLRAADMPAPDPVTLWRRPLPRA